jgi:hypothetical protein
MLTVSNVKDVTNVWRQSVVLILKLQAAFLNWKSDLNEAFF